MVPNATPHAPHVGWPASPEACSEDVCYICLEAEGAERAPCACPRLVHKKCLARWQLQKAGQKEERFCRFCSSQLPDWKNALMAPAAAAAGAASTSAPAAAAEPVMVVTLGNEVHRIKVKPGPEGMRDFQERIRGLFSIPDDVDFEVTFRCKAPAAIHTDEKQLPALDVIQLEGMDSYEAATHCASLMAAQRMATGNAAFVR